MNKLPRKSVKRLKRKKLAPVTKRYNLRKKENYQKDIADSSSGTEEYYEWRELDD